MTELRSKVVDDNSDSISDNADHLSSPLSSTTTGSVKTSRGCGIQSMTPLSADDNGSHTSDIDEEWSLYSDGSYMGVDDREKSDF
jgi:hypothetical protein